MADGRGDGLHGVGVGDGGDDPLARAPPAPRRPPPIRRHRDAGPSAELGPGEGRGHTGAPGIAGGRHGHGHGEHGIAPAAGQTRSAGAGRLSSRLTLASITSPEYV